MTEARPCETPKLGERSCSKRHGQADTGLAMSDSDCQLNALKRPQLRQAHFGTQCYQMLAKRARIGNKRFAGGLRANIDPAAKNK